MIGCLLLVVAFRSSTALGAAYGVAVTGTMAITTVLFGCSRAAAGAGRPGGSPRWRGDSRHRPRLRGGERDQDPPGRWVPLAIAAGLFLLMTTWKSGDRAARSVAVRGHRAFEGFLEEIEQLKPPRVPGTAVFLTTHVEGAPLVLQLHLRHNKALHDEVILLAIMTEQVPEVRRESASRWRTSPSVSIACGPLRLHGARRRGAHPRPLPAPREYEPRNETTYYLAGCGSCRPDAQE